MAKRTPALPYPPSIARLLTLGPPGGAVSAWRHAPFLDYAAMDIAESSVPELLRLMTDRELWVAEEPECFGPVHAARALVGIIGAAAFKPLVNQMRWLCRIDDDLWMEDMPNLLLKMGPEIIEPSAAIAMDQREDFGVRIYLWNNLEDLAKAYPECRPRVVKRLLEALKYARYGEPGITGSAISMLVQLNVSEAAPMIEAAFDTGRVDEMCCGKRDRVMQEIKMTPDVYAAHREQEMEKLRREMRDWENSGSALPLDDLEIDDGETIARG
ncbi:MAG: hypothetical protein KF699_10785 [Phycisphaeraceae bacterium]|nr:hypothetical protein [Phycisphaeraceae bacterium]